MAARLHRSLRIGLGRRIQQLRKAAGLTQEELADRAKMDWKYLGSVERGERNVTIDNIERIMRGLRAEPYEPFLFRFDDPLLPREMDEGVLGDLIRRTDKSVRPFIVSLVQLMLRWEQSRKR